MDFRPGNDASEWQVLGDEERYVLYQQVTVHEPMGWSGLSLECFKAACGKYCGRGLRIREGYVGRSHCAEVEFGRDASDELRRELDYGHSDI